MIQFRKDPSLSEKHIPFGIAEVRYPDRSEWRIDEFRALAGHEIADLKSRYTDYDRKKTFSENPYFRFFKKFKKTFPIVFQFESLVIKGYPFPDYSPVIQVPFLVEVTKQVLSGTHDIEHIEGDVELYISKEKTPFPGLQGKDFHTYPGDYCGRDDAGIIFSEIAGPDERTCGRDDSRHVFYPIFGTPGMPAEKIQEGLDEITRVVRVLAPTAEIETQIICAE